MIYLDIEFTNSSKLFSDNSFMTGSKIKKSIIDPNRAEGKVIVRKLTELKSYQCLKQAEQVLMQQQNLSLATRNNLACITLNNLGCLYKKFNLYKVAQ